MHGWHSVLLNMAGKLAYKLQRYRSIFRELKNWPAYMAFKLGIHHGKDFVFQFRDGHNYCVPKKMIGPFRECFFDDQYLLHFDRKNFPKSPVILDIGANVGYAALYFFRSFPQAIVHSFEPMPYLQTVLKKHLLQHPKNNWHFHEYGLWKEDGDLDIFTTSTDDFTSVSGIMHFDDAHHKVSIAVRSLASFLQEQKINHIDLLKMDCEGAEYEILFQLPEVFFDGIEKMAMETHDTKQHKTQDMVNFLNSKGYQVKFVTRPETQTGHIWAWK